MEIQEHCILKQINVISVTELLQFTVYVYSPTRLDLDARDVHYPPSSLRTELSQTESERCMCVITEQTTYGKLINNAHCT